jgi:hypothetical protein
MHVSVATILVRAFRDLSRLAPQRGGYYRQFLIHRFDFDRWWGMAGTCETAPSLGQQITEGARWTFAEHVLGEHRISADIGSGDFALG